MASRADIEAGKAHVKLSLEQSQFQRDLARMKKSFGGITGGITKSAKDIRAAMVPIAGAVAATLGAIAALGAGILYVARQGGQFGAAIDDVSQRLGIATRKVAIFQTAAEMSGSTIEDVERAMATMAKKGMDPRTFEQVAKEIAAIEDPQKRVAKATEIWGKAGLKLIPIFQDIAALSDGGAGFIPTKEAISAGKEIDDEFKRLELVWKNAMLEMAHAVKPWLVPILRGTGEIIRAIAGIANAIGRWGSSLKLVASNVAGIDTKFTALLLKVVQTGEMETAWQVALLEMSKTFDEFIIGVIEGFQKVNIVAAAFGGGQIAELEARIAESRSLQNQLMDSAQAIYRARQFTSDSQGASAGKRGPSAVDVSFSAAALAAMGSGAGMVAGKKDPALELVKVNARQLKVLEEIRDKPVAPRLAFGA